MRTLIILTCLIIGLEAISQVAINSDASAPDNSAMLDVKSTSKGMLVPRMSSTQRTSIASPASGLLVFDNTSQSFWFYSAGSWVELTDQGSLQWSQNGSSISYSAGNVGIGDATPASSLTVGNGDKFQVDGAKGDVTFTDDEASIRFPETTSPNNPMIYMFSSGVSNANRMVLSHSPGFNTWGLEYNDVSDAFHFRNQITRPFSFLLATGRMGIGTELPAAKLHVPNDASAKTAVFGSEAGSTTANSSISIGRDDGDARLFIGKDAADYGEFAWRYSPTPSQGYLSISSKGSSTISLQESGGRIGVGTTLPQSKFEVFTDNNNYAQLGYATTIGNVILQNQDPALGPNQLALQVTRDRVSANPGSSYHNFSTNSALKAFSNWGDPYTFALTSYGWIDFARSGSLLAADNAGSFWGALAYKNSGGTNYGGYFTSYTSGVGKSIQAKTGIGVGAWGELMGADIHGDVYGLYAEGGEVAIYANGTSIQNGPQLHLQPNGTEQQTVLYAHVSTDMTVQTSGYASLNSGKASIQFDEAFAEAVSPDIPVVVTITPVGLSSGIYLTEVSERGFGVAESNESKSNGKFAFIAVGRRLGYENPNHPSEATRSDFTDKMTRGLHNDAEINTEGEGVYFENGKLSTGRHSSTNVDRSGAASQVSPYIKPNH